MRQIDASGRRWYTASFKREVVGQCLVAGASLSKVAIDRGLNPNMVRKWVRRAQQRETVAEVKLLPVVAEPTDVAVQAEPAAEVWRHVIEVQLGAAVILVSEHAKPELVRAVVQSIR
ncbi:MAG: transposase [Burkholderiales bacterium]|nr:transposase [Burkholderiales bacterium]